jgi:hypothetical protein
MNNIGDGLTVAHEKGYSKTNKDGSTVTKETKMYVDPVTGDKITQEIKTKVERKTSRSSSSSSGKGAKVKK